MRASTTAGADERIAAHPQFAKKRTSAAAWPHRKAGVRRWAVASAPLGDGEREPRSGALDLVDVCAGANAARYGRGKANEKVVAVYVRVVRFTDVSAERIEGALSRIEESDGPPPGVSSTRLEMLFDASQGTAVVLQYFETREEMQAGAQVLGAMDASETPGTRASVDVCEVKLELTPS
jgi:hypothetical protein